MQNLAFHSLFNSNIAHKEIKEVQLQVTLQRRRPDLKLCIAGLPWKSALVILCSSVWVYYLEL